MERHRLPAAVLERLVGAVETAPSALAVTPVDWEVANAIRRIPRQQVPDMPDRIIAATAAYLGLPLVTRDEDIRGLDLATIW